MRRKTAERVKCGEFIMLNGVRRHVVEVNVLDTGFIALTLEDGSTIRRAPRVKIEVSSD
jgi:hypothetical protein